MIKGQTITEALHDILGSATVVSKVGVTELPLPMKESEEPNDIGILDQDDAVSLDFAPGQPIEGRERILSPSKKIIVGRETPGEYEHEELIRSDGELWCSYELTYTDLIVHEEFFSDEFSGRRFISKSLILEADSGNGSDIQYKFNPTGSYDTISAGKVLAMDGRRASKILVKLGTSGDILSVKAW